MAADGTRFPLAASDVAALSSRSEFFSKALARDSAFAPEPEVMLEAPAWAVSVLLRLLGATQPHPTARAEALANVHGMVATIQQLLDMVCANPSHLKVQCVCGPITFPLPEATDLGCLARPAPETELFTAEFESGKHFSAMYCKGKVIPERLDLEFRVVPPKPQAKPRGLPADSASTLTTIFDDLEFDLGDLSVLGCYGKSGALMAPCLADGVGGVARFVLEYIDHMEPGDHCSPQATRQGRPGSSSGGKAEAFAVRYEATRNPNVNYEELGVKFGVYFQRTQRSSLGFYLDGGGGHPCMTAHASPSKLLQALTVTRELEEKCGSKAEDKVSLKITHPSLRTLMTLLPIVKSLRHNPGTLGICANSGAVFLVKTWADMFAILAGLAAIPGPPQTSVPPQKVSIYHLRYPKGVF